MEPDGSLPCSQQPDLCLYFEPDESNQRHPILLRYVSVLYSHLTIVQVLPSAGAFLWGFPQNPACMYVVSCPTHVPHYAPPIFFCLIRSP